MGNPQFNGPTRESSSINIGFNLPINMIPEICVFFLPRFFPNLWFREGLYFSYTGGKFGTICLIIWIQKPSMPFLGFLKTGDLDTETIRNHPQKPGAFPRFFPMGSCRRKGRRSWMMGFFRRTVRWMICGFTTSIFWIWSCRPKAPRCGNHRGPGKPKKHRGMA